MIGHMSFYPFLELLLPIGRVIRVLFTKHLCALEMFRPFPLFLFCYLIISFSLYFSIFFSLCIIYLHARVYTCVYIYIHMHIYSYVHFSCFSYHSHFHLQFFFLFLSLSMAHWLASIRKAYATSLLTHHVRRLSRSVIPIDVRDTHEFAPIFVYALVTLSVCLFTEAWPLEILQLSASLTHHCWSSLFRVPFAISDASITR